MSLARVSLVAVVLLLTSSCLTYGVLSRAQAQHDVFRPFSRIVSAWSTHDSIFIAIDTQGRPDEAPQTTVVRAPLDKTTFAITSDRAVAPTIDGVLVHHLSPEVMRASAVVPDDAAPLAIDRLSTDDMSELVATVRTLPAGIHVLDIAYPPNVSTHDTFTPLPGQPAISGPVLGIVTVGTDETSAPLLVADIHVKASHHRAWYLLTPFAVVGDIIASPVYLVIWLVEPKC